LSTRHASGQSHSAQPPFGSRAMLMHAIDRAVDALPLFVDVGFQRVKQALPLAAFRPTIEAIEHGFPWPERLWQVSPWNARPPPPQHSFYESPIVAPMTPSPTIANKERFDLPPLRIVQLKSQCHVAAQHMHGQPTVANFPPRLPGTDTGTGTFTDQFGDTP
jgi:hypothetical protein